MPLDPLPPCLTVSLSDLGVGEQVANRFRQSRRIVGQNDQPGLFMPIYEGSSGGKLGRHHRLSAGHGLQENHSKSFTSEDRREHKDVTNLKMGYDMVVRKFAQEHNLSVQGSLGNLPSDAALHRSGPHQEKSPFNPLHSFNEHVKAFVVPKLADKQNDTRPIAPTEGFNLKGLLALRTEPAEINSQGYHSTF